MSKKIVEITKVTEMLDQMLEDVKGLNMKTTTAQRQTAKLVISIATAALTRLGTIKTPSWSERIALKVVKGNRKNLAIWNKTVVFGALLLGNAVIKVGDLKDADAKIFNIKLDDIQEAIDVAKVVLFEELIELGLDKVAIEEWILKVGKDSTTA